MRNGIVTKLYKTRYSRRKIDLRRNLWWVKYAGGNKIAMSTHRESSYVRLVTEEAPKGAYPPKEGNYMLSNISGCEGQWYD